MRERLKTFPFWSYWPLFIPNCDGKQAQAPVEFDHFRLQRTLICSSAVCLNLLPCSDIVRNENFHSIFPLRVRKIYQPLLHEHFLTWRNRSDPWSIVSLAYFLRYPNPYASHVISCDVISRTHTQSGTLLTTRLILKRGALPRWAPQGIISRAESWIVEESEVDPTGKVVTCRTRNLDHVKVMQVEESVVLRQTPDG
jgi:hypothetical protein